MTEWIAPMDKKAVTILSLIPYNVFPPHMGGQRAIVLFYRYLAQKISLHAITQTLSLEKEAFTIYPILSKSPLRYINPLLFFRLKKRARDIAADFFLFEHPYFAWLLFFLKITTQKKIIIRSHNIEALRFKDMKKPWWRILFWYEAWAYRTADIVWFITSKDRDFAIAQWQLNKEKTFVIPYGTDRSVALQASEIVRWQTQIKNKHGIATNEKILLFNGALNYKPNEDAVVRIIKDIVPKLKAQNRMPFKIILCGKGLAQHIIEDLPPEIIYVGFVDNIDPYFAACDIFLNPTTQGGGIKTKLIEALAMGKLCVSTENGAIGLEAHNCDGQLVVVSDNDWMAFAQAVINGLEHNAQTDFKTFYETFYWEKIVDKAIDSLTTA
ncbi:MAG: glycosyltransferase family 4 protein [Chitinophagaceae bacterium]